ncbi:FG-GAP-like repeat-containing protein, partial [Mesorhizobium sp. M1423]|uniref:toxin TcdB middle/N-terminal domain-containing protein n=1 Tax=Mesorhizobium sp. M1423 TaxID=2957101 RepID=UPI0033372E1E
MLVGAALLAAGVFGADTSFVSYISSSAGIAAFAQEAQGTSPDPGASGGFGNSGAALGSGTGSGTDDAGGATAAGTTGDATPAGDGPDAAAKVDGNPADSEAADAKTGTAAKTTDSETAPEEPAATTLATTTTTGSGDPEAIGTPKVDLPKSSGNGNLGYAIGIDVPDFHGIEPSIALNYNSSRKTKTGGLYQGWLGYAWGLDGFDVIERASPGYGMPAFDATDIYLLDGQAMVACVAGMVSPSCSTGGTHATENESYRRIALNGTTNEWKVTDRDGTVSTFRSVAAVANLSPPLTIPGKDGATVANPAYDLAYNYRWLLTSVTDTNGNSVAYSYTCPASPVCYPDTISYNGTVVKFYLETRPDLILMGNGRDISETSQRIKAIGVTVSSTLRSAYKLTYDQAPFSSTSRLTAVTRYGTDATIAADGTITGGTAKPLGQMTYQNTDGVYAPLTSQIYQMSPIWGTPAEKPREVGDLNFDGRDEVFGDYTEEMSQNMGGQETRTTTKIYKRIIKFGTDGAPIDNKFVYLRSNTTTSFTENPTKKPIYFSAPGRFLPGKNTMDFLYYTDGASSTTNQNGYTTVWYSPSGSFLLTDTQLAMTKSDCHPTAPIGYQSACDALPYGQLTTAPGTPNAVTDANGDGIDVANKGGGMGVGDFLGNGRQQPIFISGDNLKKGVFSGDKWQPSGTSFDITCPTLQFSGTGTCVLADVNGDGATDIFHYNQGGSTRVFLSTGIGFKSYAKHDADGDIGILRDFDNDGRVDLITLSNSNLETQPYTTGAVKIYFLQPSSTDFTPVRFYLPVAMTAGTVIGDFNGDGLPDFTDYKDHMFISAPGAGNPNLLRSVVTELGGTVAVEYAPSSTWANTYLPQVVHAVTKLSVGDGRGQTAVSTYSYAGGKYDPAAR